MKGKLKVQRISLLMQLDPDGLVYVPDGQKPQESPKRTYPTGQV